MKKTTFTGYIHKSIFKRPIFHKEGHYNELVWRYAITKAKEDKFVKVKVTVEEI